MALLAANPLQFSPCFGFHCSQLVFFPNLFLSDVWQDDFSWKQIDMDYLGNTDKQTIARLSFRVENPTLRKIFGYSIS